MSSHHDGPPSPTNPLAKLLLDGLRRSAPNHIVHVGGGDGSLLADLLQNLPSTTGVLFDNTADLVASGPVLDAIGVTERVDVVGDDGDHPVPPGGDLYLLTDPPERDAHHTTALLRRCQTAMTATARILVCRSHHPDATPTTALTDLLERAGFAHTAFDAIDPTWEIRAAFPTSTPTD